MSQIIITNIRTKIIKMRTNNNYSNQIGIKNSKTLLPLIVKILITQSKTTNIYVKRKINYS